MNDPVAGGAVPGSAQSLYEIIASLTRRFNPNGYTQFRYGNQSVAAPTTYEEWQNFKLPPGFNPGGVWNPAMKNRNTVLPEWLDDLARNIPNMSAAEKDAVYRHYVKGEGVAPAFQQTQAQMPAEVKAEMSRQLGLNY